MPSCLETQTHMHTTVIVLPFPRHRKRRKLWGKNETHKTECTWPNWHPVLQQTSVASACQGICAFFQILAGGALTTDCNPCLSCHYGGLDWWLCQALYFVQGLSGNVFCRADSKLTRESVTFFLSLTWGILKVSCFLTPHCPLPNLQKIPFSFSSWNQGGDIGKILIFQSE